MSKIQVQLMVAVVVAVGVMYVQDQFVQDARWWNLVMAGLLLAMLGLYIYRERSVHQ
jgi:hypothetical protein